MQLIDYGGTRFALPRTAVNLNNVAYLLLSLLPSSLYSLRSNDTTQIFVGFFGLLFSRFFMSQRRSTFSTSKFGATRVLQIVLLSVIAAANRQVPYRGKTLMQSERFSVSIAWK